MDSELEDILSAIEPLIQSVEQFESKFNDRFSQFEILYDKLLLETLSNEDLHQWANKFKTSQFSNFQTYESILDKNKMYLEKKARAVSNLEKQKATKEQEVEKLEQLAQIEEGKITSTKTVQDEINRKKDQVLTYKLLTKTNFLYTGKKVTGYVGNKSPRTFTFDPQETSQEQITDALWSLVIDNCTDKQ